MHNEVKSNNIYAYILFLVWPFLSFFIAFYEYRKTWAKNIVWLFVVFYAYTMVISNSQIDANRYRNNFIEISNSDIAFYDVINLYSDESKVDLLESFITYVISSFTNNYKILFATYGIIFGFFFSRNLWLLFERSRHKLTWISILLLIIFAIVNPIWNINGFRFWTAAQIFVYGALIYFLEGKKKGLLIAATTVLVHFSFMLPIVILGFYVLFGNRMTIYFYFFIASLFISELNIESVRGNLGLLPIVIENKVEGYTNEEYIESIDNSYKLANWYVLMRTKALKYSIYIVLIFLYWRRELFLKNHKKLFKLFGFVFLFFAIANIISSIPSARRFLVIAYALSTGLIFLSMQYFDDKKINAVIKLTTPALLLYFVVTIRLGFDTFGITTILGNPIIAVFMEDDMALINLIK